MSDDWLKPGLKSVRCRRSPARAPVDGQEDAGCGRRLRRCSGPSAVTDVLNDLGKSLCFSSASASVDGEDVL